MKKLLFLLFAFTAFGQSVFTPGKLAPMVGLAPASVVAGVVFTNVQQSTFTSTGDSTTQTATWGATPTSGNTLIAVVASDATVTITGWTADVSLVSNYGQYIFRKTAGGGESTSVVMNLASSTSAVAVLLEYSGLTASPFDKSSTLFTSGNSSPTHTSGATATLSQANEFCIAQLCWDDTAQFHTWVSWNNSFTNILTATSGVLKSTGSSLNIGMCVGVKEVSATAAVTGSCTVQSNIGFPASMVGTYKKS